jgi:hypothetical protein
MENDMNITIPVRKAGRSIDVDTLKLCGGNETFAMQLDTVLTACKSVAYSITYGLTQSLNDSHAADTKKTDYTPDSIMGTVQKKLDAIYNGTLKLKGKSVVSGNPVERLAMKLAKQWWKGLSVATQNAAIDKVRAVSHRWENADDAEIAVAILASNAKTQMGKAADIVAANAKKVDVDIDIADFMDVAALPHPDDFDESDDDESDE